jgi:hypothetical protein
MVPKHLLRSTSTHRFWLLLNDRLVGSRSTIGASERLAQEYANMADRPVTVRGPDKLERVFKPEIETCSERGCKSLALRGTGLCLHHGASYGHIPQFLLSP